MKLFSIVQYSQSFQIKAKKKSEPQRKLHIINCRAADANNRLWQMEILNTKGEKNRHINNSNLRNQNIYIKLLVWL